MAIRKGASFRDAPQREKSDASKLFEAELDLELANIRIAELESLVRDMWRCYEKSDANEYRPGEVTHSADHYALLGRMRSLGIEADDA